jgi:hypothetical protein
MNNNKKPDAERRMDAGAEHATAALAYWRNGDLVDTDRHLRRAIHELIAAQIELVELYKDELPGALRLAQALHALHVSANRHPRERGGAPG